MMSMGMVVSKRGMNRLRSGISFSLLVSFRCFRLLIAGIDWYGATIDQYLQNDLNYARPPIQRARRETANYQSIDRPRSPLVLVECVSSPYSPPLHAVADHNLLIYRFTRVIMDEVQQIGGGKAAEMVSLTQRLSSIAVSGTPARSSVEDLIHVLRCVVHFSKHCMT